MKTHTDSSHLYPTDYIVVFYYTEALVLFHITNVNIFFFSCIDTIYMNVCVCVCECDGAGLCECPAVFLCLSLPQSMPSLLSF